ncbi:enoyl-CoA hydratase [Caballeronia sordidicola]|uniref:Enoyl-CoA hydratase n=1 Tax=Caballeronia sordidicola TaxID=196367 RepID=A0A242N799_CABSO|nr:enoyl-CoA hydratase [Caballeronia sordidicola]OTP79036.1 Enoyl-CoA hydratase [Caballeronia sordidicola]
MVSHDTNTGTTHLLADLTDGVLTLTMNRPDARNAMTLEMLDAMTDQLARAETANDVHCIVLTGSGKGFCSGGDVKAMADPDSPDHPANATDAYIHRQRLIQRATAGKLFHMPKPTLAVINGAAAGAGLALALACDLRIMANDAILMTAFSRVGVSGDFGGTYFMTQLVGAARARELYFLSDRVSADRAVDLGLANWTCPLGELPAQALAVARRLAEGPGIAYRYMKENLNRAMAGEADDCLDLEATHHVHCMFTADHREATAAFVEKREPIFTGG